MFTSIEEPFLLSSFLSSTIEGTSRGRAWKETFYASQLQYFADGRGRSVKKPRRGSCVHGRQDRAGVRLAGRHHRRRSLFRPRGVLSDPLSGAGNTGIQEDLPGSSVPYHQRRHGTGHGKAGQRTP